MTTTAPIFIPVREAKRVEVFGGEIHVTISAASAGSGVSVFEDVRRPGDGPPLHVHHGEDEVFRVLEGRFRLRIGGETFDAAPGDTMLLPRDVPHSFVNNGDTMARMLCILQPGGFERFFFDVAAAGLQVPKDMARIADLAARYRLEFLGPNPFTGR